MLEDGEVGLAIHEDQEKDAWAAPRKVLREPTARYFEQQDQQSNFAKAGFVEYHWRERRRRSPIYFTTLLRLREVGWVRGPQKEIKLSTKKKRRSPGTLIPPKTKTGAMIREARLKLELNQDEAAPLIGYSKVGFASVERGDTLPQPRKLAGIAKGLDLDFGALCEAVAEDRRSLGKHLGTAGHSTYYPPPSEPGQINKRVVMDYLIDDMDFDKKLVAKVVEEKSEYTDADIKRYVDLLVNM